MPSFTSLSLMAFELSANVLEGTFSPPVNGRLI